MISQNTPVNGGNVYRSGGQGAAVGKSTPSQTSVTSYSNARSTETKTAPRVAGAAKPKGK